MKRLPVVLAVCLAAALMVVGWVVTASGAPAPGTVQTFEVRVKENGFGVNCGNRPQRACFRKAYLASVGAGNAKVFVNGAKVGTVVFANITGKKLKKQNTLELFFATIVFDTGDTLSIQGASSEGVTIPYSVTGGTGAYAGASGTAVESDAPGSSDEEFRLTVTVTFL